MKNKSKVTHNIAIAAAVTPEFDIADITTVVVDALMPTGVYPQDIEVAKNVSMGIKDVLAVSAIMGIFGFGLAVGTLEIAGAIGNTIMHIARRRQVKPEYHVYPEKDAS